MNKENTKIPMSPGWHWWLPSTDSSPVDILVMESDIRNSKFKNFGGEWHQFPTFNDVCEYRASYIDLHQRAKVNETKLRELEFTLNKFLKFINYLSTKTFIPKAKIKEFLLPYQKTSTQELPPQ